MNIEERQQRYAKRLAMLVKTVAMNAPQAIVGFSALLVAEAVFSEDYTRKGLIRHLLDFEKQVQTPMTPEEIEELEVELAKLEEESI